MPESVRRQVSNLKQKNALCRASRAEELKLEMSLVEGRPTFLVLDLALDVINGVGRLDL